MNESGSRELRALYPKLILVEGLSRKWSISTAKALMEQMSSAEKLLKTKKVVKKDDTSIKKLLRHCIATLAGVIAGREDKILEKIKVKSYLRKLVPVVNTLREKIEELDILKDIDSPPVPKNNKTLTIRPGETPSAEAQIRLAKAAIAEDGTTRTCITDELSPMEQNWEEAEFISLIKEHKLEQWNSKHYGEIGEDLIQYHDQVGALKKVLTKQALLQIAPVVPAARHEQIFRVPSLARNGVKVKFTAGYPVFENQLVLAVNTNELSEEGAEAGEYRKEVRNFKKKIEKYAAKFSKIAVLEGQVKTLKEEIEWMLEQPAATTQTLNKEEGVTNPIAEVRATRLAYLEKEKERIGQLVVNERAKYTTEYAEFAELSEKYSAFTKEGRAQLKGKMGDQNVRVYELAEKCLAEINSRLSKAEQLVFVSPLGTMHGYLTYFWVMKDSQFGPWSGDLCFSKLKLQMSGWCFPKRSQTNRLNSIEQEAETQQELIAYVHEFVRKERSLKFIRTMVEKWLALRRIKYTDYYSDMVKKIYEEAPEILEEQTGIKKIKLIEPKIGKRLLFKKK